MKHSAAVCRCALVLVVAGWSLIAATGAESPSQAKPSAYAPAADLVAEVESYVESLQQSLQDKDEYGADQQNRVALDASTVAALALVLEKHDEKNKLQAAAPALIKAARKLAEKSNDYAASSSALAELQAALDSPAGAEPLPWRQVADLSLLMKQVPIVNNSLRRGVSGRRFKRSLDKCAGQSATLAAIAQAATVDTAYCEDKQSEARWAQICTDMRDAAAEVNKAIRKADQQAAEAGLAKLAATCDSCHHEFRD